MKAASPSPVTSASSRSSSARRAGSAASPAAHYGLLRSGKTPAHQAVCAAGQQKVRLAAKAAAFGLQRGCMAQVSKGNGALDPQIIAQGLAAQLGKPEGIEQRDAANRVKRRCSGVK